VNNSGVVNWSLGTLNRGQVSNLTVTVTVPGLRLVRPILQQPVHRRAIRTRTNNVTLPVTHDRDAGGRRGYWQDRSASVFASSNLVYTISVTTLVPPVLAKRKP